MTTSFTCFLLLKKAIHYRSKRRSGFLIYGPFCRHRHAHRHAVTVVGLDMSSAFDAVCHQTLIDRLQSDFDVTGTCLQWITSYLSERSSSVRVNSTPQHPSLSVPTSVFHGGSVLRPVLFTAYVAPVGRVGRQVHGNYLKVVWAKTAGVWKQNSSAPVS